MKSRVLIVDDSLTVRMDLAAAFAEAGFETLLCASAAEAHDACAAPNFDIAVLDVMLPDGDGIEIMSHLRASPLTAHVPVILLSSEADVHDRVAGFIHGADDYLGKPYDAHHLVRRARDLVGRDRLSTNRPVVLLIDDSLTYRQAVAERLDLRGYEVMCADSGEEGLRKASEMRPDVVVVDGFLPGIDGATVIRRLRVDPALLRVPCLYLTGSEEGADELAALDAGADLFARKDADLDAVASRVAALLRAAEESRGLVDEDVLTGGRRLLLIGASPEVSRLVRATLSQDGHDVIPAGDKDEAAKLLALQIPDAVLIETRGNPQDTVDACRRVREMPLLSRTPLIVLGPRGGRGDSTVMFDAGADDWLPIEDIDEALLRARVRALLRRGAIEGRARRVHEQLAARARALSRANDELTIYRQLIDRMPLGAVVFEAEDGPLALSALRYALVNPAMERMTAPARLLGRRLHEVMPNLVGQQHGPALEAALADGQPQRIRGLRRTGPDGGEQVWDVLTLPLLGGKLGLLVEDVTERERAVEERDRMEQQMHAAQRLEAVGQLAGGIAHDFNNILTVIKAFGGFLHDQLRPADPLRGDVDAILTAADRAASLTTQLLAFSRKQVQHLQLIQLNETISEIDRMLRRVIGEDVALQTDLAAELWPVRADVAHVEQVLMNLVVNARDAMPRGGRLTIATRNVAIDDAFEQPTDETVPAGDYVAITVSDSGAGMSAEVRARVFEPFFTTKEKGKGTGLGLASVYGIVRQSGGHIWVDSEVGLGTTFHVYLPRVVTDAVPGLAAGQGAALPVRGGEETILLVEDEEMVRRATARILERAGYRVIEAHRPGEAILLIEQAETQIDAMITDVVMPEMGGRELARRLLGVRPDLRVIFMSGYADAAGADPAEDDPDAVLVQKPFSPATLLGTLRQVLDRE